jgi:putative FmdB family regulatory protein
MPIYAYRCTSCGHAQDVLQKISDPLLTTCTACGAETFTKQVTAAGFQLKGSGWYVTDFRGGNGAAAKDDKKDADAKPADGAVAAPAAGETKAAEGKPAPGKAAESKPAAAPSPAPAPAAAPSAGTT